MSKEKNSPDSDWIELSVGSTLRGWIRPDGVLCLRDVAGKPQPLPLDLATDSPDWPAWLLPDPEQPRSSMLGHLVERFRVGRSRGKGANGQPQYAATGDVVRRISRAVDGGGRQVWWDLWRTAGRAGRNAYATA